MPTSKNWHIWVLIIAGLIPFDFSTSIPHLTSLSTLDFVCAGALLTVLISLGPLKMSEEIRRVFKPSGLLLWGSFLIYTLATAILLGGNVSRALRWGEFLFSYFLASLISENEKQDTANAMAKLLTMTGLFCAGWGLVQFVMHGFDHTMAGATFRQHNILSAYLSLCLPGALAGLASENTMQRVISRVGVPVILAGLFAAFSRGAVISLFVAIGFLVLWKLVFYTRMEDWRRTVVQVVLLTSITALSFTAGKHALRKKVNSNGRTIYVRTGLKILRAHPYVGLGPGNYPKRIRDYISGEWRDMYQSETLDEKRPGFWIHLHNVYLQIAVEYGLVGFSLWAAAMGWMLYPLKTVLGNPAFDPWVIPFCFLISIVAFLTHNLVDILFVNSFDLLFVFMVVLCRAPSLNPTSGR